MSGCRLTWALRAGNERRQLESAAKSGSEIRQ
jgi:hypothetical protein